MLISTKTIYARMLFSKEYVGNAVLVFCKKTVQLNRVITTSKIFTVAYVEIWKKLSRVCNEEIDLNYIMNRCSCREHKSLNFERCIHDIPQLAAGDSLYFALGKISKTTTRNNSPGRLSWLGRFVFAGISQHE